MHRIGSGRSWERTALIFLGLAIFSDAVTKRDVIACPETQSCVSIRECRRLQKEANFQMDLFTSVVYPCEDPAPGICCIVGPPKDPEETENEDPGYTVTHDELPQPSEALPVALPLNLDEHRKIGGSCGSFEKGNTLEDASNLQFPWLALIGSNDAGSGLIQYHCGGSLINYQYVLTSASCISNMPSPPVIARLGEYDFSKEDDCSHGCTVIDSEIEQAILHQSYDYPFRKNDIALLRLKDPLPRDKENIVPICLPTSNLKYESYSVAGWGINDQRNFSVTPKFGTLGLDTPKSCEADLSIALKPVGEKQLCSRKIKGSCFGDGGGPLIAYIRNGISERAVVAGIISERGPKCNSPFSVDLFTNVAYYLDWIAENVRE